MNNNNAPTQRFYVNVEGLPRNFPTHRHSSEFWEHLGRAIATFGFLEETLGKAIFALTAERKFAEDQIEVEFKKWIATLEKALSDSLASLIKSYAKAVQDNPFANRENLDDLLNALQAASKIRDVLCHGSWRAPDDAGRSLPLFVNRKLMVFDTPIDIPFLEQTQRHVAHLAADVVNSVSHLGIQFPGSNGPGRTIFE